MLVNQIHHVGIAVADLDAALRFWRDTVGLPVDHIEEVPSYRVKVAFLPVGDSLIELVFPTSEDTDAGRLVKEKGGGLDHLCLEVENLDAVLAEFSAKGVQLINQTPVVLPGRKIAFVHPMAAGGVLLEFYELTQN